VAGFLLRLLLCCAAAAAAVFCLVFRAFAAKVQTCCGQAAFL